MPFSTPKTNGRGHKVQPYLRSAQVKPALPRMRHFFFSGARIFVQNHRVRFHGPCRGEVGLATELANRPDRMGPD